MVEFKLKDARMQRPPKPAEDGQIVEDIHDSAAQSEDKVSSYQPCGLDG